MCPECPDMLVLKDAARNFHACRILVRRSVLSGCANRVGSHRPVFIRPLLPP